MASKVYFTDLRTRPGASMLQKLERLVKEAGIGKIDFKDKFVAVKIHFGEYGNMAYVRPNYAAVIVRVVKELGGRPFLTDCNTMYSGSRSDAVGHLETAMLNGFNRIATGCDIIIADGLRGTDETIVDVSGKYCPEPKIGNALAQADIVISVNHFKGHEQSGFGGALKNLGMGSGSVAGKADMHSTAQPRIVEANCIACSACEDNCAHDAIHVTDIARIDYDKCVGCGQCIAMCSSEAAVPSDVNSSVVLNCKIDEYAKAVLKDKPSFHVSFIMSVSPECDCWAHNDAAIVPDLGIAASFDPVALDQACADLVNAAPVLRTPNRLSDRCLGAEGDKFKLMHPDTDWETGLRYAQEIGLGVREYELVKL